jgi:hypothetical protein
MKTVAEDRDTITIQFTREEAANVRAAVNYISALFEYLDREALDLSRMTMEEADQISDAFTDLTTAYFTKATSGTTV